MKKLISLLAWVCWISANLARPHILILTVDTFRPDFIGAYNGGSGTPALDSIIQQSVLFEKCYATSAWTSPGLISVLTGFYPSVHEVISRDAAIPPQLPTIFKMLTPSGYYCPDLSYLSAISNFFNLGLMSYPDRETWLDQGNDILFHFIKKSKNLSQPFCAWYHHRDLHMPYQYEKGITPFDLSALDFSDTLFARRYNLLTTMPVLHYGTIGFEVGDNSWVRGLYEGQIRKMDRDFFAPLFSDLKENKLWDSLLLVITADHGEELLEHGFVGHGSTSLRSQLHREILHIPLIIHFPGHQFAGQRINLPAQQVDIVPTILAYLGLPIPSILQGINLMPLIENQATPSRETEDTQRLRYAESNPGGFQAPQEMLSTLLQSVFNDTNKMIRVISPTDTTYEWYRLSEDPAERFNHYAASDPICRRFSSLLDSISLAHDSLSKMIKNDETLGTNSDNLMAPLILAPRNLEKIKHALFKGAIKGEWSGADSLWYIIQYNIGQGRFNLKGEFRIWGRKHTFGPFTPAMWNTLALYNPWRIQVYPQGHPELISRPLDFTIAKVDSARTSWLDNAGLIALQSRPAITALIERHWLFSAPAICSYVFLTLVFFSYRLFRSRSSETRRRITSLTLFTLLAECHFFSLGVIPLMWEKLYNQFGLQTLKTGLYSLLAILGFSWLIYRIRDKNQKIFHYKIILDLIILVFLYWKFTQIPIIATRMHIVIYSLLAWLLVRSQTSKPGRFLYQIIGIMLIMLALGAMDEFVQFYLPVRYFDWSDIGLNWTAALGGIFLALPLKFKKLHADVIQQNSI